MVTTIRAGITGSPNRKVTIGAAVSSVCAILVWTANTYLLSEPIPAEIGMSIATVAVFITQYFVQEKKEPASDRPNPKNGRS